MCGPYLYVNMPFLAPNASWNKTVFGLALVKGKI